MGDELDFAEGLLAAREADECDEALGVAEMLLQKPAVPWSRGAALTSFARSQREAKRARCELEVVKAAVGNSRAASQTDATFSTQSLLHVFNL